jgi:hypothetical protein
MSASPGVCDDGHSGARLDRPGQDELRDAAEAGFIEPVWCLTPDRLARIYAYQVIVLDELARQRVSAVFADAPAIVTDEVFAAAVRVSQDNSRWSPRRAEPGQWLQKGLDRCAVRGVGTNCNKMRDRNGTWHRYYYCRNHDPMRAGGQDRRCPERKHPLRRPRRLRLRPGPSDAAAARHPASRGAGNSRVHAHIRRRVARRRTPSPSPLSSEDRLLPLVVTSGESHRMREPGPHEEDPETRTEQPQGVGTLVATSGDFNLAIDTSGANALVDQRL